MPQTPLSIHSDNPHYLHFRGKPTTLITSGEHYGAVMNGDFDYIPYLDTLTTCEFDLTRIFSGTYREVPGSHGIEYNTLAPEPRSYICPWLCVERESDGAPVKWDLTQWDEDYWHRLRHFVAEAGNRGVVVEYVFFCFMYSDSLWQASPMHPDNNVNGLLPCGRYEAYTLGNAQLLAVHDALVRKAVEVLNGFDNVYFEIINEPYFVQDVALMLEWQHHLVDLLVETERTLPNQHLIAINYENRVKRIEYVYPEVSILNFHYAVPDAVAWNYHLNRVLGDDETGFKGATPSPYRTEAWSFILSGGAILSHLDYSYTVAHPDGTAPIVGSTPGHGGYEWRAQLTALKRFLDEFEIPKMSPQPDAAVIAGTHAQSAVLADVGQSYAIYLWGGGPTLDLVLTLPAGDYEATWINPADNRVLRTNKITGHPGGGHTIRTPTFLEDLALKVIRVEKA